MKKLAEIYDVFEVKDGTFLKRNFNDSCFIINYLYCVNYYKRSLCFYRFRLIAQVDQHLDKDKWSLLYEKEWTRSELQKLIDSEKIVKCDDAVKAKFMLQGII